MDGDEKGVGVIRKGGSRLLSSHHLHLLLSSFSVEELSFEVLIGCFLKVEV